MVFEIFNPRKNVVNIVLISQTKYSSNLRNEVRFTSINIPLHFETNHIIIINTTYDLMSYEA